MHWACGGDIFLKRSFDSGRTWLDPKVGSRGSMIDVGCGQRPSFTSYGVLSYTTVAAPSGGVLF
jgi:hypothetical protein